MNPNWTNSAAKAAAVTSCHHESPIITKATATAPNTRAVATIFTM